MTERGPAYADSGSDALRTGPGASRIVSGLRKMRFGNILRMNRRAALGALGAIALPGTFILPASAAANTANWPCWRGPTADGVAEGANLPTRWSRTTNIRWSAELPGWGRHFRDQGGERVRIAGHERPWGKNHSVTRGLWKSSVLPNRFASLLHLVCRGVTG